MAKAVLIMDEPKNCYRCPLSDTYCFVFSHSGDTTDYYTQKPDYCPLIPEPARMTEWERKQGTLNDRDYEIGRAYTTGMTDGWNACLDALEKGNEGTSPSQHLHDEAGRK